MTFQQSEILRRTGTVCVADNGSGFQAYVTRNARRSPKVDSCQPYPDDDDTRPSTVESAEAREDRIAHGRKLATEIENKLAKADAARIEELDRMLPRFENFEARRLIGMARANGFHFDLIMEDCCKLEREEKNILNLLREYRRISLGLPEKTEEREGYTDPETGQTREEDEDNIDVQISQYAKKRDAEGWR